MRVVAELRDLPGHEGGVGGLDRWRLPQLRRAQHGPDLPGPGRGLTAVRAAQRGGDPGLRQRLGVPGA